MIAYKVALLSSEGKLYPLKYNTNIDFKLNQVNTAAALDDSWLPLENRYPLEWKQDFIGFGCFTTYEEAYWYSIGILGHSLRHGPNEMKNMSSRQDWTNDLIVILKIDINKEQTKDKTCTFNITNSILHEFNYDNKEYDKRDLNSLLVDSFEIIEVLKPYSIRLGSQNE
jgi:hypothetical protein